MRVLSRPADYLSRPLQRIQLPRQRLSTRAAIAFCSATTLLIWIGIAVALAKLL